MKQDGTTFMLDDEEITQAMTIAARFQPELHDLVASLIERETGADVPEYVVMAAVTMECLLMAKCMHLGTPESFVEMALDSVDQ